MLTADYFRSQATRCRLLANSTTDSRTADTLSSMALEYEQKAVALDAEQGETPMPKAD